RLLVNLVPLNSTNDILVEGDYADDDKDTHMTREENYVNNLEIDKKEQHATRTIEELTLEILE
ncbi:6690_t:CDS:2, partial [Cetraspora pellucida]